MASPSGQVKKGLKGLDLRIICGALGRVKTKWFVIGIQLGIPRSKLLEFEEERDPLSAVVEYWLNGNVTDPAVPVSWKTIIIALKSEYIGEPGLAEELNKNYCPLADTTKADQETSQREDGDDGDKSSSSSDSTDVELDLKQQLDLNRRQIEKQYAFYVASVQTIVEEKGITAKNLSSFLLNLLASATDDEKRLKLLADMTAELKNVEEVVDVFFLLSSKYASFLNPDIYASILEKYGSKEEQKELNYPECLKNFIKRHTIKEFCEMYPKLVDPKLLKLKDNSKKIRIKFNISRTQSLSTLEEVIGAVAKVLGLRPSIVRLYGVKKGCVLVTLLIPSSIADTLFTRDTVFSPEQQHGFQAASVMWIECNGHKFDFREKDKPKDTPGGISPQQGDVETVTEQTYPNLDSRLEGIQVTPLHSAVESCDILKSPEVKLQTITVKAKPAKVLVPKLFEKLIGGYEGGNMLRRLGIFKNVLNMTTKFETTPLHRATESHDVGKVRKVLGQTECSVNSTDSLGWTPLHYASAIGNLDMVRMLVSEFKADLTVQDEDGTAAVGLAALAGHDYVVYALLTEYQCPGVNNALFMACIGGHTNIVRTLLHEHSADINVVSRSYDTPLHVAALSGKDEVVMTLIKEFGCNTKVTGRNGRSLLHSACEGGNVNLIRTLICEQDADINARNDYNNTPLHVAARYCRDEVVQSLIKEFGCDTKVKGRNGKSLLHCACEGGSINLVRTLILEHNADINARSDYNNTPVNVAALFCKDEVVLTLIKEFDCDTKVKNKFGRSLLHLACEGGSVNLVRTLIHEHHADVNARDNENNTPLHVAARFCKYEVVLTLIQEFGCDTEVRGRNGRTLLHSACKGGSVNLVRTLIREYNADINARDNYNHTPLHTAAQLCENEVVLTLIKEFGCDTMATGFYGRSLLHSACKGGSVNLVRTLIHEYDADINAKDDYNSTPLHYAAKLGQDKVVEVLMSEFGCEH